MQTTPSPKLSRSERKLMTQTAAALWFVTTVIILTASLIPELAPEDVNFWRGVLGVPALLMSVTVPLMSLRFSDKWFLWSIRVGMAAATLIYLPVLQLTPATIPILFSLLVTIIYAGFFLQTRDLLVILTLATGVALSTLFTDVPSQTPHLESWLTVYVPTMWAIAGSLRLQKVQLRRAIMRARRQARIDPLTGLANLRALSEHADIAFADDAGGDLRALLLIDLDNFKSANTLYGHLGGDEALRVVGEYLQKVAPRGATVARIGGDEFAVVLRAPDRERVAEYAEIFRSAVIGANVDLAMPEVTIDASVGMAIYPQDGETLDELLTTADIAMYEQKSERPEPPVATIPMTIAHAETEPKHRPHTLPDRLRNGRGDYTLITTLSWLFAATVILISLLMPGAYAVNVPATALTLAGGYAMAGLIYAVNTRSRTRWHAFFDLASMFALLLVAVLTGGVTSPVITLMILQVAAQAWFWREQHLLARIAGPLLVTLLLPPIDLALGRSVTVVDLATTYAVVSVVLILTIVMYLNQRALAKLNRRASDLALTDPLTGVANRRAFEAALKHELSTGEHSAVNPLAIVMIDLDNFKNVNTRYGHRAGDLVLADIAASLAGVAREDDVLARIGGDEFAALLPGVDIEGAHAIAERFISAVANCESATRNDVGASVGFALCPLHGDTFDELIAVADDALMAVKKSGKGVSRVGRIVSVA